MAIDSHTHINSKTCKQYNVDKNKEIATVNNCSLLTGVVNVGLNIETSKESIIISKNNEKFYSSIGIHPLYIKNEDPEALYSLVNDKVVAIGEIGLDKTKDDYYEQRRYLILQLIAANTLHLPVIIHANNSNREVIEIFEKYIKPKYGCVFHCFQPDIEVLDYLIKNHFYISFAGRVTYKNAKKSLEVLERVPNDLYLVETDSPYISPEPLRDSVGSSTNLEYIIRKISDVKGISFKEVENQTENNAKSLFQRIR